MGQIGCIEKSATHYQLLNVPEERRSQGSKHTIIAEKKWGFGKVVLCSECDMECIFVTNLKEMGFEDMIWLKWAGDHSRYW
jgi:hypothetical protein